MKERPKRPYTKPQILSCREIEAMTGSCLTNGNDTGQDKITADPNTGACMAPMT